MNAATDSVVATIPGLSNPRGIALSPDGSKAYAVNKRAVPATVSVIGTSTDSVVATVALGGTYPIGVAITPDGTRAYVTVGQNQSTFVAVVDTTTNAVSTTVLVGVAPTLIAINPMGTLVYVPTSGSR